MGDVNKVRRTRCINEVEKRERLLEAKRRWSRKPWICELCDRKVTINNKMQHLNTTTHKFNDMKKRVNELESKLETEL